MAIVFQVKEIRAKKLKVAGFRKEIKKALFDEGKHNRTELEKTVSSWRDRPNFESLVDVAGSDATVITGPTGRTSAVQKWTWTDEGTRPHVIRARNAPALRFRTGFTPKTSPRKFSSGRSSSSGPWRRPLSVNHPGTKAREWSKTLQKRRKRPFTRRMVKAMQAGSARAF